MSWRITIWEMHIQAAAPSTFWRRKRKPKLMKSKPQVFSKRIFFHWLRGMEPWLLQKGLVKSQWWDSEVRQFWDVLQQQARKCQRSSLIEVLYVNEGSWLMNQTDSFQYKEYTWFCCHGEKEVNFRMWSQSSFKIL